MVSDSKTGLGVLAQPNKSRSKTVILRRNDCCFSAVRTAVPNEELRLIVRLSRLGEGDQEKPGTQTEVGLFDLDLLVPWIR